MSNRLKNAQVLVTGSSGFLGSRLCQVLKEEGNNQVIGIDLIRPAYISNTEASKNSLFRQVDITNFAKIEKLFSENAFDIVFHLAAVSNPRTCKENFDLAFNVNVIGTKNLLLSSEKCNNFIFMSSASVYGEPSWVPIDENHPKNGTDPYSITKKIGEDLCLNFVKNYARTVTIARIFNSFGIGQAQDYIVPTLITQALKNKKIEIWNSKLIRDMTYLDDTIDALCIIGTQSNGSDLFNIGSGKGIQIGELANTLRDIIDKDIEITDLHKHVLGSPTLIANNKKLIGLGWKEKIGLRNGLIKTTEWFKSQTL